MDILNTSHTSKKFYYEISDKEVNFLVTTVYITSENKLNTKIHIKPTDRQSYLHKNSEHPRILKKSIPYPIWTSIMY